jgi:hypothetical protein
MTDRTVLILRRAAGGDHRALRRLAELDSARPPREPVLVAEADGDLVAAMSLADGAVIADPFRRTDGVVAILRAHRHAAAGDDDARGRHAPWHRARRAAAA